MTLAERYNAVVHAGVLLAMLAFGAADEKPLLLVLAFGGTALSWLLSRRRAANPHALPRLAINGLVLAAIANAAVAAGGARTDDPVVSTLGQFLVHVTLIKLLDRRSSRDDAQVIALGVFDAIAAMLTSNALPVGLALMAYVPTAVASAMLWQLRAGEKLAQERAGGPALAPAPAGAGDGRAGFLRVCLGAVAASACMATAVFLLTPRGLGNDFLGQFGVVRERQVGYREDVKLGEGGFLSENPTPVLDLKVENGDGENIGGPGQAFYLRGAARDYYDPRSFEWRSGVRGDESAQPSGPAAGGQSVEAFTEFTLNWRTGEGGASLSEPLRRAATRVQTVTMRAEPVNGAVFCLWRPESVTFDRRMSVRFSPRTGSVRRDVGLGPRLAYTVRSIPGEASRPPERPRLGFQQGFVRETAERILRERGVAVDPARRSSRQTATALRDALRQDYQYTTILTAPPAEQDPIVFFLRDLREGHCEYFASAMAALCQSVGVPARVVTGYLAMEFNTLTGQYVVRESNAHAWCEVFIVTDEDAGVGRWETFDPSPQGDIERIHRPAMGLLARLRSWYEAVEFGWSTSVVGFDTLRQGRLMGREARDGGAGTRGFLAAADRLAVWLRSLRGEPGTLPAWVRMLPGLLLLGVVVAILAAPLWRRFGPSWARLKRPRGPAIPARRAAPGFYRRALRALGRSGVGKPSWTPPRLHAAAVDARSGAAGREWRALVDVYYRARFGGAPLTAEDERAAAGHAEALEAAFRDGGRGRAP